MRTIEVWTGWQNAGQISAWDRLDTLKVIQTFSHFRRFMRVGSKMFSWRPEYHGETLVWRKHWPRSIGTNRLATLRWVGSRRLRRRGQALERQFAMRVLMEEL